METEKQTFLDKEFSFWSRGAATLICMGILYIIMALMLNSKDANLAVYSLTFGLLFSIVAIVCFIGNIALKRAKQ